MSKEKIKELIVCLVVLTVFALVLSTSVRAIDIGNALGGNNDESYNQIDDDPEENIIDDEDDDDDDDENNVNEPANNVNLNTNVNTNTNTNGNTNKSGIPYAGVDYSVVTIIVICGVSALYAYKKIRDYKSL